MKKLRAFSLAIALAFSLTACGSPADNETAEKSAAPAAQGPTEEDILAAAQATAPANYGYPNTLQDYVENGDNVGGASMFLTTTEISHPIWRFIRGAVFCDVGSVWEKSYRFNPGDLNVGVGYGLRIKVPVLNAPIKLDLAYPVLNNQDDLSSKLRFHFNMGFTW